MNDELMKIGKESVVCFSYSPDWGKSQRALVMIVSVQLRLKSTPPKYKWEALPPVPARRSKCYFYTRRVQEIFDFIFRKCYAVMWREICSCYSMDVELINAQLHTIWHIKMKKQFFRVKQLADQRFARWVDHKVFVYMHVPTFQNAHCSECLCQ
jgi:hypothetical protein